MLKMMNYIKIPLFIFLVFIAFFSKDQNIIKRNISFENRKELIELQGYCSKEECRIINNFLMLPIEKYPSEYKAIAEDIRNILHTKQGARIGSYILETMNNYFDENIDAKMYLLLKISTLKRLSDDLYGMLIPTIEFLSLAKKSGDEYMISVGTVNLASILNFFDGYHTSNQLLNAVPISNFSDNKWNRLRIRSQLIIAENNIAIGDYNKSSKILKNIITQDNGIPSNEWDDYHSYILALQADIAMHFNRDEEARKYLDQANSLLNQDDYNFLVDKHTVIKTIELKWAIKNNINVYAKLNDMKFYHDNSAIISSRYLKMLYESIFDYYFESNDHTKYHELRKEYLSKIEYRMKLSYKLLYNNSIINVNNDLLIDERDNLITKLKYSLAIILVITLILILVFIKYILINSENLNDELTKIGNRKKYNRDIKKLGFNVYYLVLIDIDNFKLINDRYGHDVGDYVLKKLSNVISHLLPNNSEIYRIGGEEFAIIFRGCHPQNIVDIMNHIRINVENLSWNSIDKVTISIGIARSDNSKDVYKKADELLYLSKTSGKNQLSIEEDYI